MKLRFNCTVFQISHLCEKTSTEIGYGHIFKDNIEVDVCKLSMAATYCSGCAGDKDFLALDRIKYILDFDSLQYKS